ncbi:pyridoxamine 5'-phosphate oxidase family protein [Kitasatospora sp. NPDC008050]|uniref:pyridoxamine 5'-phosphate oxidase family protein n=1 Tax=Kitasatospora sp. NPDC008050 TaxID=3364021 RepID=UPI0036DFD30E
MSREEVAHRAGMSLEYTHLLQRLDLDFHPAALRRIAAVLDMSYEQLMSGRADSGHAESGHADSGRGESVRGEPGCVEEAAPADARLMITRLTEQECWEVLGARNVGYLGYLDRLDAWAVPMDYLVDGRRLVYRASPAGPLAAAAGASAVLESEGTSPDLRHCWNVLAAGPTTDLAEADLTPDLRTRMAVESGAGESWMCLTVTRIMGRKVGVRQA